MAAETAALEIDRDLPAHASDCDNSANWRTNTATFWWFTDDPESTVMKVYINHNELGGFYEFRSRSEIFFKHRSIKRILTDFNFARMQAVVYHYHSMNLSPFSLLWLGIHTSYGIFQGDIDKVVGGFNKALTYEDFVSFLGPLTWGIVHDWDQCSIGSWEGFHDVHQLQVQHVRSEFSRFQFHCKWFLTRSWAI